MNSGKVIDFLAYKEKKLEESLNQVPTNAHSESDESVQGLIAGLEELIAICEKEIQAK